MTGVEVGACAGRVRPAPPTGSGLLAPSLDRTHASRLPTHFAHRDTMDKGSSMRPTTARQVNAIAPPLLALVTAGRAALGAARRLRPRPASAAASRTGALNGTLSLLLVLVVATGLVWTPSQPVSAQQDARYFADTGFRIDDDKIWDYFNKRGGTRTFGQPTSRTFQFLGAPSQFFQRHVLQVTRDGVRTLNLLDEGILPYTTINGLTFPAVDPAVVGAAPKPSADYGAAVVAYLKQAV